MWAFAIAGMTGLLLGFQYRVPAVLAASCAVAAATLVACFLAGHSFAYAILFSLSLLGVLQGSYVLGLVAAIGCGRIRHEASDRHQPAHGKSQFYGR